MKRLLLIGGLMLALAPFAACSEDEEAADGTEENAEDGDKPDDGAAAGGVDAKLAEEMKKEVTADNADKIAEELEAELKKEIAAAEAE